MFLLRLGPATEDLVDGEGADLRKRFCVTSHHLFASRVQVVPGGDVLACVGVQKLKAGFGLLARAASVDDLVDHAHRVLRDEIVGRAGLAWVYNGTSPSIRRCKV